MITFDEQASGAGESRGIAHFGFRLVSPGDIDAAVDEVERAGGKLLRRGEFSPGYQSVVALTLSTGVVAETGIPVPDPGLFQSLGIILTLIRFDEETQTRRVGWRQTTEYPAY